MLSKIFTEQLVFSEKLNKIFGKINIIYLLIFVLWFFIAFMTGLHHEAWIDEGQAWLIARDTSFHDLIFSGVLRYEGHPVLWYFIVKIFILLRLPYEKFFIIPLLFTSIGMFLFLFKSNFPNIIKILFPFTMFVCYLFPVIARNHSLLFPILAFIAVIYPERLNKPLFYSAALILLLSVSAHSYVIAGILFLFFCWDIFKNIKENGVNKKLLFAASITGLCFIGTILYLLPSPPDLIRYKRIPAVTFLLSLIEPSVSGYFNLEHISFWTYPKFLCVLLLYISGFFAFCKNKSQTVLFISIPVVLTFVMKYVHYSYWHSGYFIISFIFVIWLLIDENKISNPLNKMQKIFCAIFGIMLLIQIQWSVKSILFDCKLPSCASKAVAQFVKENNLDKYEMNGIGFKSTAIQPYFTKNIYSNFKNSYWTFTRGNYIINEISKIKGAPVLIIEYDESYREKTQQEYLNYIIKQYNVYPFEGYLFLFGRPVEKNILLVCVKKNL